MTEASRQPKDKNYNPNVETLKSYVQDAEQEGDQELVEFFNEIVENNKRVPSGPRRCSSPACRASKSSLRAI
jgi:hypothetical protein